MIENLEALKSPFVLVRNSSTVDIHDPTLKKLESQTFGLERERLTSRQLSPHSNVLIFKFDEYMILLDSSFIT